MVDEQTCYLLSTETAAKATKATELGIARPGGDAQTEETKATKNGV